MKKLLLSLLLPLLALTLCAQTRVTRADYDRAENLGREYGDKMMYGSVRPAWIGESHFFWYQTLTPQGNAWFLVDAVKAISQPAFDAVRLAEALAKETGSEVKPTDLPIRQISFSEDLGTLTFTAQNFNWSWNLKKNRLTRGEAVQERRRDSRNWSDSRDELANQAVISPDSTREAFIRDHNVWVRDRKGGLPVRLSVDGVPGSYYSSYMYWSPDSKKLIAVRHRPAWKRLVHYVESSPANQVQPRHETIEYTKPGDELPHQVPTLFLVDEQKMVQVSDLLFPQQYSLNNLRWRDDSRAFTFEYNERGHQLYRVLEINGSTGVIRTVIEERSPTFIHYSGKRYRFDLEDGKRILWASERDGWNHLYLYDGETGRVINQVTRGAWPVREVLSVDEEKGEIIFAASGREPGIDPYLLHHYRIRLDGSGLVRLTDGDGNHEVVFSADKKYFTDTWSRVDEPPVTVLRNGGDGSLVMEIARADISGLIEAGWQKPEVFSARGRDGVTDIWGIIVRPSNFDPSVIYPVIENIYAGPHSSHVPKSFRPYLGMQSLAELGFIVVQIDGMGTSNRSKAFHDVCWRNLGDAGFPDRILWMQAAAAKYPYLDLSRVGIYGTSAGGQNAMGALLFHPDFYDVAVASCGCHDNRMDKIWWNEQWMGYPVGEWYETSSNVVNAGKLQGKLLLILGEMDKNVDPSSTMQVVDALIKASKEFDFVMVPGMGHSSGGSYGEQKRLDFFVRHLHGTEPPAWK